MNCFDTVATSITTATQPNAQREPSVMPMTFDFVLCPIIDLTNHWMIAMIGTMMKRINVPQAYQCNASPSAMKPRRGMSTLAPATNPISAANYEIDMIPSTKNIATLNSPTINRTKAFPDFRAAGPV